MAVQSRTPDAIPRCETAAEGRTPLAPQEALGLDGEHRQLVGRRHRRPQPSAGLGGWPKGRARARTPSPTDRRAPRLELQVTTGDGAPRILILNGHPRPGAFADALAEAYRAGASGAGAAVETLALRDLDFDRDVTHRRVGDQPLEPSLAEAQAAIARADQPPSWSIPTWWPRAAPLMKSRPDPRVLVPWVPPSRKPRRRCPDSAGWLGVRTAR